MSRVGLSEEEESNLLLLLEGDVSDIEIKELGDKELLEEELFQIVGNVEHECEPHDIFRKGIEQEAQFNSDDDIPLAKLFSKKSRPEISDKPQWKKQDMDPTDINCNILFTVPDVIDTPLNYFKKLFDNEIINNLVEQTNIYSVQKAGTCLNTTFQEMCNYLDIHVLSGIVHMPSYRMYWAEETGYSPIADVMSRNSFEKLRSNLHINDNDKMLPREHENYDKLFKVRPFIDALKENLKKLEPEEYNSIDEIMIPFKGHSSLKQYIKNKPHKWGIKMFARAGVSEIIYEFGVYVGKDTIKETSFLGFSRDICNETN